jgi:hypothetical protein
VRRRLAAIAVVAVLLLSGCTQRYDSPDERAEAFGHEVAESLKDVEPRPADLQVRGNFDGIVLEAQLDQMSFSETRDFIEAALPVVEDSPLGALPVRIILTHEGSLSHEGLPSGSVSMEWRGYDPVRSERYFAAVQLWLDVLADPEVQFKEKFDVEAAYVYGAIEVFDGRDLDAYRAELVGVLEQAGYTDPRILVTAAVVPAS